VVKNKLMLLSIASIPLIMTLGNSMLIPVLPAISRELEVSSFQVSLLITVYAVVAILLIPVAGFLSDRFGRKAVIIPSLIIAGAGGAVCAAAAWWMNNGAYPVILAGRFLQGIGAAGAAPIVLPLVGDLFQDEKEVSLGLGVIETSNTFGKVLSPILGSALAMIVWFAPFISIPLFCLASVLLVGFMVKPPKRQKQESQVGIKEFIRSVGSILKEKGRWLTGVFAAGGIAMLLVFGVLFYLSNVLEEQQGLHGIAKGGVLAIPLGALCLASFITGRKIGENKKGMKLVSTFGLALTSGMLLAEVWLSNIYAVIGVFALAGAGIGAALPSLDAIITESIDKKQRGTVTSLYSSMRFIGVSAGPPLVSLLVQGGQRTVFLTLAAFSLAGVCLTAFMIKPPSGQSGRKSDSDGPVKNARTRLFVGKQRSPI
jgi:MFS transporter, ACDE family, multidrug resistance protein